LADFNFQLDIGKRLRSPRPLKMEKNFPGSGIISTLPGGKTSEPVTSFLKTGYFQIERNGMNWYVKNADDIELTNDESDDSGFFESAILKTSDWLQNSKNEVTNNLGHLNAGFQKSVGELSTDFSFFSNNLMKIGIGLLSIAIVITAIKIFK